MSGLFSAWNQILERTGGNRRLVLAGAAVVAVVLVWGVAHWASEPVYVTLYKDLEFADVARIGKILDDAGREVPTGSVGRIFVGNEVQFDGYTGGGNNRQQTRIPATVAEGYRRMGIDIDDPEVAKRMVANREIAVRKGWLPEKPNMGRILQR